MTKDGLCLHSGAHGATIEEVNAVVLPPATRTHVPIPHTTLIEQVKHTLGQQSYRIAKENHALTRDGQRYFGTMLLASNDDKDFGLTVGIRNSHDKSIIAGMVIGATVFVCDNLSFSGEVKFQRKHTRNIATDLPSLIARAVGKLADMRGRQQIRFDAYKQTELSDMQAHDMLLRLHLAKALPITTIGDAVVEWRNPRHPEFVQCGKTAWRLWNSITESLKGTNGNIVAERTMRAHGIFDTACNVLLPDIATPQHEIAV